MSTKKPEDIPQWAWDEACHIWAYQLNFNADRNGSRKVLARAILKSREEAFEEMRGTLVTVDDALRLLDAELEDHGYAPVDTLRATLASANSAIRQHSQKGER